MAEFFIRRPIVAMVISIVLILLGVVAIQTLPIAQFPDIVPPMIQVKSTYFGASAVDVEQSVATPLEQQVNGVENMIYMKSINGNDGTMTLQVSFEVGTDLDNANVLTQNRVSQATAALPQSVKEYGVTVKKSLAFPLVVVTLSSPDGTYDNNFLSNYAGINLNDVIARIRGVGDVVLFGGSDYSMRIWVKPDYLAKLGLTVNDLVAAVQEQNVISPAGQIGGAPAPPGTEFTYTVRARGRLMTAEEFGTIVVRTNPDGSQVHLRDVARIELGTLLYNQIGRNNGEPAAVIMIYQQPGSNALAVAAAVKDVMEQAKQVFPPGLDYTISLDTTLAVEEGINEILHTLVEAVLLVILVVFVFLQNWRATLIPLLTVPVSLIATFVVFPLLGFSINTLSLLGLVLAIGIVVDDAIVVVEAVMHHIEQGLSPKDATVKAMKEVSGPIVAVSLVLAAVFVPVAFMGGITGRLFQQFAVTIAISVMFSALNALTLSPALSAKLLKPKGESKSFLDPFYRWFNRGFDRFTGGYLSFTAIMIRRMFRSLVFIAAIIVSIGLLGKHIPGGFVPEEDNGYFLVAVQLPDAASLQRTDEVCRKVERILGEDHNIENYTAIAGYGISSSTAASNMATFFVGLKPWHERHGKEGRSFEMIEEFNRRFAAEVPEAFVLAIGPPPIQGLGTGAGFSFMLQDRSGNTPQDLADQVEKFIEAARQRPEIGSISSPYRASVPQISAVLDPDRVTKQGVTVRDVNTTLAAMLGGSYINDFNRYGRVYKVYLLAEPEYRDDIFDIGSFFVRNNNGSMVPLSSVIRTAPAYGPEFTNRFNLYRSAELTGVPAAGYSSSQALNALEEVARDVLPAGWGYDWSNVSYQEKKAAGTAAIVFVFALVLVFLVLAAQYESWGLPFSVLLGTPFAVFGAFLGLWIMRFFSPAYVNNVFTQIGLVTLIGLAAKNAILIVEFAKVRKEEGVDLVQAALDSAKLRLRPILMTSFAFILGVMPLVRAAGAGAEARKVLGMTVFAGLLVATVMAIFLIPVLFVAVERATTRRGHAPVAPPGGEDAR
ncbi:MAG: multidrug efflux RND transporter permease subunit [Candidatus Krumholzibacteria bacterium]|nr:multidrug efflux RND transporter permease subunit [Candidatus Krumholzibacteria bacterium]MDH4336975.1 multidrug efflux RND transporter permease subunit [Candidatus Krumholzibacteria bacterium]MDH5269730.1 multidrug efflux RND transporter permease subunit [Candidatus Krumholzibacteria bacterium]